MGNKEVATPGQKLPQPLVFQYAEGGQTYMVFLLPEKLLFNHASGEWVILGMNALDGSFLIVPLWKCLFMPSTQQAVLPRNQGRPQ